ncbi:MAG TPA: alpha/beta hydrolase fold domain-containing protein [Dehalococcoidia bacterium]|jgi:acetyl esterase/lipase
MSNLLKASLAIALTLSLVIFPGCVSPLSPALATTPPQSNSGTALLFGIGIHIEPLGATTSNIVGSSEPSRIKPPGPDYHNPKLFQRHVQDIETIAGIVESHGGRLTIQAQTPFTQIAAQYHETVLADLENRGHEIALHFHEDAHLGKNCEELSASTWAAVMAEEIDFIKEAGATEVRYWSGGNLYPHLLEAASQAGLEVMSDWKNPNTQTTDESLIGVNPWRPAASPNGADVSGFARHDPNGEIIYLPEGHYSRTDFASMRRASTTGGDEGYFEFLEASLHDSIESSQPGKVNVFHFTIHPGEFKGDAAQPYAVLERFLTEAVDPLVANGSVEWATFSQMADAFEAWEQITPGIDARASAGIDPTKLGEVERDVTYGMADGVALKMDIYYPEAVDGTVPAVLYVHGGGWTKGDKNTAAGATEIPELISRGYLVAAVNYRLAPQYKFPAQIEDVKCAVRYLRANAERYGIDPDRIGAWGGSAGGHLVSLLGTADASAGLEGNSGCAGESSRVQAVVDMFGPTDLSVVFEGAGARLMEQVFGTADKSSDIVKRASPVTWVSGDDPPFLILHGENDTLVPLSQSTILYDRLVAAGVPATLVIVENAGHGFMPAGGTVNPSRVEITKMVADFFDEHLK